MDITNEQWAHHNLSVDGRTGKREAESLGHAASENI
jgi:hypothetical protein